uniref:hypothetical protein n=1 Tax=Pseudomonas chlororaphis TaxID=587753 RepID=UPI00160E1698|nr:hypothetical protein [Pseudomonas chlororaphis]
MIAIRVAIKNPAQRPGFHQSRSGARRRPQRQPSLTSSGLASSCTLFPCSTCDLHQGFQQGLGVVDRFPDLIEGILQIAHLRGRQSAAQGFLDLELILFELQDIGPQAFDTKGQLRDVMTATLNHFQFSFMALLLIQIVARRQMFSGS